MQFPESFLPLARDVGLLPMLVELFLLVAQVSFLAGSVFFLARGNSVHPAHRASNTLSAILCLIAGVAYWSLQSYYRDLMHAVAVTHDLNDKRRIMHDAFYAINQYRYMNWAVAAPLLTLKMVLLLKVKPREIPGWIALLVGGAFWMVLACDIGDQEFSVTDGSLVTSWHLAWGVAALVGYAVVPYALLRRLGPKYGGNVEDESGHAFRLLAWSTVTTWSVYVLAYFVPTAFPHADMNWVHLALTAADVLNIIGAGAVAFMAGAEALSRRAPPESVQSARIST